MRDVERADGEDEEERKLIRDVRDEFKAVDVDEVI